MATQISPQQRALNFGAQTRKHIQTLGKLTGGASSHMEFEVPKARLLQKITLFCEVELKKASASVTSFGDVNDRMKLYNVLRRVSVDYNNGFSPVVASGKDLAVINMLRTSSETMIPTAEFEKSLCTITSPVPTSTTNRDKISFTSDDTIKYKFALEIPLTLNDRDPSGLVLAQNGQTLINCSIDVADKVLGRTSDYTTSQDLPVDKITVIPVLTSFSIPTSEQAFPDLSVLKIVESRKETLNGGGSNLVKLPVGQIYRKLIIYLENSNGEPLADSDITSNIELLFNTADIPYSINPSVLRHMTISETGEALPKGYYAFDLSYAGIPNLGGSRDYIDAERLTTFEIRFTTSISGTATIISEKISRLITSK